MRLETSTGNRLKRKEIEDQQKAGSKAIGRITKCMCENEILEMWQEEEFEYEAADNKAVFLDLWSGTHC